VTALLIVVLFLLFLVGGGGWGYSRRGRSKRTGGR